MPRTPLDVKDFETEANGYDELEVNNYDYQGTRADQLNGKIADGPIEWTSDHSITKTGWKICATNTNTCILWECSGGLTKRAGVNSITKPSDSVCCEKFVAPTRRRTPTRRRYDYDGGGGDGGGYDGGGYDGGGYDGGGYGGD